MGVGGIGLFKKKKKKNNKKKTTVNCCCAGVPLTIKNGSAGWRSGAVVRVSDFGPRGPWFEPRPMQISLWP